MFVEHNLIKNIKIFTLAFTSPWYLFSYPVLFRHLPLSIPLYLSGVDATVRNAVNLVYLCWRGVVPVLCGMFCTNLWNFISLFYRLRSCSVARRLSCCVLRNITLAAGDALALWIDQPNVWQRLFWLGLVTPIGIKCSCILWGASLISR